MMPAAGFVLLALLLQVPPQAPLEDEIRLAVQQYYDAQAARDPDKAASFWSAAAMPRMTRDAFITMFGEQAEDTYTVEVRAVELRGNDARVRVAVARTRVIVRNGQAATSRFSSVNSQLWRKEAAGWKILRDGPMAQEIADDVIAAAPADRPAVYEKNTRSDLVQARLLISQRATMAITVERNYARGKQLFELALEVSRATDDRRGEMNSFHNIGQALYFMGDRDGASAAYEKELAVAREVNDESAAAGAFFGLATVNYGKAEYTIALGQYREALALYEKREDGPAIGRTVVSIGNVQYLQAEYDAALASYRRGLALAVESSDRDGATFARRGLGRVLAAQGDIPAALDMYGQVLTAARTDLQFDARMTSGVSTTLESIGDLYFRLGNTDQARTALEEAKRLAASDPESGGRILSALGLTELVAGRFDAAFATYSESRAKFEAARHADGSAHAWVGIGFSQSARRKFSEAVAAYRTAIGIFDKLSNEDGMARAWLGLSLAQSGAGEHAAALESARTVTMIADRLKSDDLAWRGAERSGEALRKLERLHEARQAFEWATGAIDRLAADAPVSTEARGALADSASAWAGLAFTLAKQGDAAGALRAMEARRAHIRRAGFAAFQHDIARGATPEELADEQAIVREIISTRAQMNAEARSARRDAARTARLGEQLAALAAKRADQQARLYARLPELPLWRGLPQPAMEPAALNDLVPGPRGLLVAYLVTDDELLIVTVGHGEGAPQIATTATAFDRRAFADALAAAMQPAVLRDAAQWRTKAAPLAAALLDPIASRLAERDRIVFVPDDLLWKIPFEALPLGDGDVTSRASVTYGTSMATMALQRRGLPPAEHPAAAVLAAPTIPDAIRAQLLLALSTWTPQDADASRAAAQAAATAYGDAAALRVGADASEAAARTLIAASDVLHVQAPLQVSGNTPLLSSIVLAATGEAPPDDGRFEARDWFDLAGRARVVVLPDGSGFGAAGVGHAMDSLAWAAAGAGVSTLVIGRWPVDGFAADALAAAFHAKLAGGVAAGDAWRAAVAGGRQTSVAPGGWTGLRFIGGGT
jgi:tetratricopeptide (TPR) repeat protein